MSAIVAEESDLAPVSLGLPATGADGAARQAALEVLTGSSHTPTSLVTYESRGSLLIVGREPRVEQALESLQGGALHCSILEPDAEAADVRIGEGPFRTERVSGRIDSIAGHLGRFVVRLARPDGLANAARLLGHQREDFDLLLDLGRTPLLQRETLPPGYFAPLDSAAFNAALAEIPEWIGEFDKPRFFNYDPAICAHGASNITGCTRCLDTCPTQAIRSLGERIEVDPYLCQGGGVCATACPTGAITYAYPQVNDLLDDLRRALHRYHAAGGRQPIILFHDRGRGGEQLQDLAPGLPENLIPVAVEEVGSVGIDAWLSILAYGAHQVLLFIHEDVTASVVGEMRRQADLAAGILAGMGYPEQVIMICTAQSRAIHAALGHAPGEALAPAAGFAAFKEKRTTIRLAVDHLYEHAPTPQQRAPLPAGAPFGEVRVDREACTLCMGCVSVCPASALRDGGGSPALQFIEGNCVQCGLCAAACPEDAITLEPQFCYDADLRIRPRTLNEERPFECVSCGKPFSTTRMIERMREKLKGHWMFQDPAQMRRLEMCENCRVEDMFRREGGLTDPTGPAKTDGPGG